MRLTVIGCVKTGAVVFHNNLNAEIRGLCPDGNAQRSVIGIHTMLNGVFYNGLQSQRWKAEMGKARVCSSSMEKGMVLSLATALKFLRR